MSDLNLHSKINRAIPFFHGLRRPEIRGALLPYGFTDAVLEEGVGLISEAGYSAVSRPESSPEFEPDVLDELIDFESTWFPIARATPEALLPRAR